MHVLRLEETAKAVDFLDRERYYRYTLPEDERRGQEAEEGVRGGPRGEGWRHDPNSF